MEYNKSEENEQDQQRAAQNKENNFKIHQAHKERKQKIYQTFKSYNEYKNSVMQFHYSLCIQIFNYLEINKKKSQQGIKYLIKFFQHKYDQQKLLDLQQKEVEQLVKLSQVFDQQKLNNNGNGIESQTSLKNSLASFDHFNKPIYPQTQNLFSSLKEATQNNLKERSQFSQFTISMIVSALTQDQKEHNSKLKDLVTQCQEVIKKLDALNKVTKYQSDYYLNYAQSDSADSETLDFYYENLKVKYQNTVEEYYQKCFGASIYNLWITLRQQESKRLVMYKSFLTTFVEKEKVINGNEQALQKCLEMLNQIDNEKQLKDVFDVRKVIRLEELREVKRQLKKEDEELTIQDILELLTNFCLPNIQLGDLIKKKFKIEMKKGTLTKTLIEAELVVTMDHNLLFMPIEAPAEKPVELLMNIDRVSIQTKKDGSLLLTEKNKRFVQNITKEVYFQDSDKSTEFEQYIDLIKNQVDTVPINKKFFSQASI